MKTYLTTQLLGILFLTVISNSFGQSSDCDPDPSLVRNLSVFNGCTTQGFTVDGSWGGNDYASCIAGSSRDDGWFVVYGTGNNITVSISAATHDFVLAAFTGCGGVGELDCAYSTTGSGSIVFPTTYGTPYFIQIQRRSGGGSSDMDGDICATSPGTVPNDLPCGAIAIPVAASCSFRDATNSPATDSGVLPVPSCAGYAGGDVWFTAVVPASGDLAINTAATGISDAGMSVYSAPTCAGPFVELGCDDNSGIGNMPFLNLSGLVPASTVYIRVWEKGNNRFGGFQICASEAPVCGNPNEDWCDRPATLTPGAGNFQSSTYPYYTSDTPGNLNSEFCGTVENNSWYQFVATNTTEVFNFTQVNNCVTGRGIQAEVYEVSNDAMGCCSNFNSVSNCWSPGTETTGTVTATGLTIGNTYILMVDGWAGDNCDFQVDNWVASGIILPVELINFTGISLSDRNTLTWKTITERDNDYFSIQRSIDGITFETIGRMEGAGTTTEVQFYAFDDYHTRPGITYYRLEQVDFNGAKHYSDFIAIQRTSMEEGLINAYPNPTNGLVTIEVNKQITGEATLKVSSLSGTVVHQDSFTSVGLLSYDVDLSSLDRGVYIISYIDQENNNTFKLIKD